jgi:hypothetical protein
MKDNLKRYIRENREAFDSETAPAELFARIVETRPSRSKTARLVSNRWRFAAASVIAFMVLLFFTWRNQKSNVPVATETEYLEYDEDPVYSVQIAQFKQIIDLQQEELKQLQKNNPALYNEFARDISQLDSAYRSLKDQLGSNPNRETLLEAMLGNLQLQTELLTKQLTIIREIKLNKNSYETRI